MRSRSKKIPFNWDAAATPPPANDHRVVLLVIGLFGLVAALVAGLIYMSRPAVAEAGPPPAVIPSLAAQADQKLMEKHTKIALECLGNFFSAPQDLMKLATLRPYPTLGDTYKSYRDEITKLTKSSPSPGGNLKHQGTFVGIPLRLAGLPERIAWIEIRDTTARLDLDSLLGVGDVRWEKLNEVPPGTRVFLRGTLARIEGKDDFLELLSADGKSKIMIFSPPLIDLENPRKARVTLERTAESALRAAGWKLIQFHGWEWLHLTDPPHGPEKF